MVSRTVAGPVTSAATMLLNWPSCGLLNAGLVMRLTLNTTSSGVSGVPSWNFTSVRMSKSITVSLT